MLYLCSKHLLRNKSWNYIYPGSTSPLSKSPGHDPHGYNPDNYQRLYH